VPRLDRPPAHPAATQAYLGASAPRPTAPPCARSLPRWADVPAIRLVRSRRGRRTGHMCTCTIAAWLRHRHRRYCLHAQPTTEATGIAMRSGQCGCPHPQAREGLSMGLIHRRTRQSVAEPVWLGAAIRFRVEPEVFGRRRALIIQQRLRQSCCSSEPSAAVGCNRYAASGALRLGQTKPTGRTALSLACTARCGAVRAAELHAAGCTGTNE
jgi:hypothetical protein